MSETGGHPHFSFTRTLYDACNLEKKNQESFGPGRYRTDYTTAEHDHSCFLQQYAPFQHAPFPSIPANYVDAESELRNQTRVLSRCSEPKFKYNPYKSNQFTHKLKDCKDEYVLNGLVSEHTRVDKPCDVLSEININRFHPLCEDLQKLNKIHSNAYIGSNTRLAVKDVHKKERENSKTNFVKNSDFNPKPSVHRTVHSRSFNSDPETLPLNSPYSFC